MGEGSGIIKELLAKFTADTSELDKAAEHAGNVVKDFGGKAVMAAGLVSAGFAALAIHQAHVGDEMGKMSDKFGVSTTAFSRLDHAASLADVSTEALGMSFRFMQTSMVKAVQGSEEQSAAYGHLGLSAKELINLKPEDAFKRVAEALSKVQNPAERTALAIAVFGRAGAQMIPMLKDGAEGLKKAADEADRFGLTINRVQAGQLEAAVDAVKKIGDAASGAARQFAVGLAPAVSVVIEHLLKGVDAAGAFQKAGSFLGAAFVEAMTAAQVAVIKFKIVLTELEALALLTAQAVKAAYGGDQSLFPDMAGQLDDQKAALTKQLNEALSGNTSYITEYNTALKAASDATKKLDSDTSRMTSTIGLSEAALKKQRDAAEKAAKAATEAGNKLGDSLIKIKDDLLSSGSAWDRMKKMALDALNEIGNALIKLSAGGSAGGGVMGSIAGLIFSGVSNAFGGSTSWIGTGNGAFSNQMINWNASGGVTDGTTVFPSSGGMQGAGEMGAEGIFPLTRVNGKLGIAGGGGQTIQNFYIQTGVAQTVQAEMMRLLPAMKQQSVKAAAEAQYRRTGF